VNWKINNLPDILMDGKKSQRFLANRDKSEGTIKDDLILEDYGCVYLGGYSCVLNNKSVKGHNRVYYRAAGGTHRIAIKDLGVCEIAETLRKQA